MIDDYTPWLIGALIVIVVIALVSIAGME